MGAMACQITSLAIVYSTVYSGADQSKHQSSASLAFVWGIHRGPVNSPHKWQVTRKMFPFDDVIMNLPGANDSILTETETQRYCKRYIKDDIDEWIDMFGTETKEKYTIDTLIRQHSCHSPHNSHTITHLWGQDRVCLFQVQNQFSVLHFVVLCVWCCYALCRKSIILCQTKSIGPPFTWINS